MAQYIDKSALAAEIEKIKSGLSPNFYEYNYDAAKVELLEKIEKFLDTLEVKEVDLEKYYHDFLQKEWFDGNHARTVSGMMFFTAKHFYELGLKTVQKGE